MQNENMVEGFDLPAGKGKVIRPCAVCVMGKQQRKPFPNTGHVYPNPMSLVHLDVQGPIGGSTGVEKYILVLVDEATHYTVVILTGSKAAIPDVLITALKWMGVQSGHKLQAIRTDRGTEFLNSKVEAYLAEVGAEHQAVPAETKQQNGTAERMNKTLVQRGRCIRLDAELPIFTWPECVKTACDLLNPICLQWKRSNPC